MDKKIRVALLRPPQVHPYWYSKIPSLGISYLASYLLANDIEAKIFDANFKNWNTNQVVSAVKNFRPDLIGISSMTHEIVEANRLAGRLKKKLPKVPIVVGGCHITALPAQTIKEFPNFDFGIYQEGEKPVLELVKFVAGKGVRISRVPNLVYRTNLGQIKVNPAGPRLSGEELDKLSYPAFDQYYSQPNALSGKNDYYPMMTGRGCPYSCAFCMQVLGHQLRRRSPENITAEIEYALKRFGVHTINFWDEIFLFNDQRTFETLELFIKNGLNRKIHWRALTRANLVDEKLIHLAKKAGCYALDLGVESGSDEILKRVNKQITVAQVKKAVGIIKKSGIQTFAYFILGHPGESKKTIRQTIDLAVELNTNQLAAGIMVPYPGTKIYQMAKRGDFNYRLLSTAWSCYDKYGGVALELTNLPLRQLEKWQRRIFLEFYLRNWRFLDLVKFIFEHKKEIFNLVFEK